ncbi:mechanosensitive ion channel family protein [Patescibacteria group bacterium]|nr:mechanosensitive ion channel family protein [Patescibacteria group bacterium]
MVLNTYIANEYLRAVIVAMLIFVFIRLVILGFEKIASILVKKKKTKIGIFILEKLSFPLTIFAFLLSIYIGLREIIFEGVLGTVLNKSVYSTLLICLGYLGYIILNAILFKTLESYSKRFKKTFDRSFALLINTMLKILIVVFIVVYIFATWNVNLGPILAGLGIIGIVVGLALQPTLSNIFSGLSIIIDKTVGLGDLVYLDKDTKGTIEKVGFRSTKIKTFDNEMLIIPNNKLAEGKVQNVSLPEPKSRVVIPFSVAYGSDIEKVKKIVLNEVKKIPQCESYPEPLIRFTEMSNSSLDFKAYFWVDSISKKWESIDKANTMIYDVLNRTGISIPFPQLDVHLKK